jgi:hypothetical protein
MLALMCASAGIQCCYALETPSVDADGSIHVPAFVLPESSLLSPESKVELTKERNPAEDAFTTAVSACPPITQTPHDRLAAVRECQASAFYATGFYRDMRAQFPVAVTSAVIGGVSTEVVMPQGGIPSDKQHRVRIDLHGGSFLGGARTNSQVESIPVAFVGMQQDIRTTDLYHESYQLHKALRGPGTGRISDVTDVHASPDGRYAVVSATMVDSLEGSPSP